MEFELTIAVGELPYTYALDRAANWDRRFIYINLLQTKHNPLYNKESVRTAL
jgi:hypothetical protein